MEGYATIKQLCGFYQISKSLCYEKLSEMEKAGGDVLRIGRAVRVKISDFDKYLHSYQEEKDDIQSED